MRSWQVLGAIHRRLFWMRRLLISLLLLSLTAACVTSVSISSPELPTATATVALPTLRLSPLPPTASPTTVAVTTPTRQPDCTDSALWVEDLTVPDDTPMQGGQAFTKTWRIKNTGTCTWNSSYHLAFASGDRMNAPVSVALDETPPGSTLDISLDLVAPYGNSRFTSVFQIEDPEGQAIPIGLDKILWVKIIVGTLATVGPTTPPGATPSATKFRIASCHPTESASYLSEIATLINRARADAGLPALGINAQLAAAAQAHSVDMACHGLLSHTGSDGSSVHERIAAQGYAPSYSLEVIYGSGYPQSAVDYWMNDQPHREAILSPNVSEMGVGYAYVADTAFGGYYTVDLASP
jgi:uncharacterized protein YkwD